jgi:hypothetical protein
MIVRLIVFPLTLAVLLSPSAFGEEQHSANSIFPVQLFLRTASGWQARDAMVNFEADRLVLRSPKDESQTDSIQYADITAVEYSHSIEQRKVNVATALGANVFAPLIMRPVENHWLSIHFDRTETYLNLNKKDYRAVLAAFEAKSGKKVTVSKVAAVASSR